LLLRSWVNKIIHLSNRIFFSQSGFVSQDANLKLAGSTGLGFIENVARKQSDYEIIWVTILLLGMLGLLFDMVMRLIIEKTIPWRGKG